MVPTRRKREERVVAKYILEDLRPRVRYELLTGGVWISAVILAFRATERWHQTHEWDLRTCLPAFHVLPWFVAYLHRTAWDKPDSGINGVLGSEEEITRTTLRVLWTAYLVLTYIEFGLY
jgi:hypothetical protein